MNRREGVHWDMDKSDTRSRGAAAAELEICYTQRQIGNEGGLFGQ